MRDLKDSAARDGFTLRRMTFPVPVRLTGRQEPLRGVVDGVQVLLTPVVGEQLATGEFK